jgi:hypothetical protein
MYVRCPKHRTGVECDDGLATRSTPPRSLTRRICHRLATLPAGDWANAYVRLGPVWLLVQAMIRPACPPTAGRVAPGSRMLRVSLSSLRSYHCQEINDGTAWSPPPTSRPLLPFPTRSALSVTVSVCYAFPAQMTDPTRR